MKGKTRNWRGKKNSPGGGGTAVTEYINSFFLSLSFHPTVRLRNSHHNIRERRKGTQKEGTKKNIIDSARGTYRRKIPPTPTDLIRTSVGITRHTHIQTKKIYLPKKRNIEYIVQEQLTRSPGSGPPLKCGNVLQINKKKKNIKL